MRLAIVLSFLAWATPIAAQPLPQFEGSWAELLSSERRDGRLFLLHGRARLLRAVRRNDPELGDPPRWALIDQALVRLESARRALPDDPDVLYLTALALSRWERTDSGVLERRADEALDAWHEVRRAHPHFHPDRVAFELALLHARRREYAQARAEYANALFHHVPYPVPPPYLPLNDEEELIYFYWPVSLHTLHADLAEVSMLDGDLEQAIVHYQAALEASRSEAVGHALARWGLALALDRRGSSQEAWRVASRVLRDDPIPPDHPVYGIVRHEYGLFAVLHIPDVFFEPPWEIHAYEGLGHEALAREAAGAERAEEERQSALRSWRLFLSEGGAGGTFAANARAHITRLEAGPIAHAQ